MNSLNQKILIVDDIEDNRFTLERRLSRNGYTAISQADCGKKALELVKEENFDLILLDLMMPEMNGFEFLNKIKGTKFKSIPVLVLTGADLQDEDIKFLKGETEKIIQKTDDTVLSIAEEINKVMKETG